MSKKRPQFPHKLPGFLKELDGMRKIVFVLAIIAIICSLCSLIITLGGFL